MRSLRKLIGADFGFKKFVIWSCIGLYIITLLLTYALPLLLNDVAVPRGRGIADLFSPNSAVLYILGATGAIPVFEEGRWWTVLSAGYLHGGFFHIAFNLVWLNHLAPSVSKYYGAARLTIIYTVSIIVGAAMSSWAGYHLTFLPDILQGARLSIGASGGVFGLFGALVSYGQITKKRGITEQALAFAAVGFVFGFFMGRTDNWGHLGGFLGGYFITQTPWFNPQTSQKLHDFGTALLCYVFAILSIGLSALHLYFLVT
ncbi:MAG: rhomboid family intramembrane serine protease [Merismopedia sp. SIO2A8]|nr:rhomboid family intramembrane serine protease [Merismopedia sp. SIO2A8]